MNHALSDIGCAGYITPSRKEPAVRVVDEITGDGVENVTSETLSRWVRDAADRLTDLVADLDDERLIGPRIAIVNPPLWEIGHVTWFQETFVLRRALGEQPILDQADAIFDSGAIPHDTRWSLTLP
ncbi:MAG: DinB family protein, partial [Pseudonocardia sp.]|nr:DinB family protein [Pseudonocardia sp.]